MTRAHRIRRLSFLSFAVSLALASAAWPRRASADDPPFTIGARPAWLVLGGITTGGTVALADRGAFVGGELSVARVRAGRFAGGYADGYYDWGAGGAYATAGLELGYKLVGLDGGPALRFADGDTELGVTGRLTIGVGLVGIFARYAYFDTMTDDHVVQVGLVLKLPLVTIGGK